jgi:hypothetical protein
VCVRLSPWCLRACLWVHAPARACLYLFVLCVRAFGRVCACACVRACVRAGDAAGGLVVAACRDGSVRCFDIALQPMPFQV